MDQIQEQKPEFVIENASQPGARPRRITTDWEQRRKQINLAVHQHEDGRIDYKLTFQKAGKKVTYTACHFDGTDKIVAQGNHSDSRAAAMVQAVLDRGWSKVNLQGSLEHQVAVARLLQAAGVEIGEMSQEARAELERTESTPNTVTASTPEAAKPEVAQPTHTPERRVEPQDPRDKLAMRWLAVAAPVNGIEAAKLRKSPERLRQMFETHPEARRWELAEQNKAAGVPEALQGFKIEREAKPQDLVGTVRYVGEQIWVEPQNRQGVVVPLPTTDHPLRPGQRITVRNGEIARHEPENTPRP